MNQNDHKSYKSNSSYRDPVGLRQSDNIHPYYLRNEDHLISLVYRYNRDLYKDVNEFISHFGYMENLYQKSCNTSDQYISIKYFLEQNAVQDSFGVFDETSFSLKNNIIYFANKKNRRPIDIYGSFRIQNYTFYATNEYLYFQDRSNGKQYLYRGEVFE